ncbi:MAG: hypothetical protein K940chlam2_00292 [Chlamydiae bacterium]|nr:hypothetical protein [Chlamydiota bacterium]
MNHSLTGSENLGNAVSLPDTTTTHLGLKHDQGINNLNRSGELFMYCVWVQGIMATLIVLAENSHFRSDFVEYHEQLDHEFVQKRTDLLKKPFSRILNTFYETFDDVITSSDRKLLDLLSDLRDLFAHCHLSLGRPYLLWGPKGPFEARIRAFGLKPEPSLKHQLVKFDGSDEAVYLKCFDVIQKLDQGLLSRAAEELGIGYRYVR